MLALKKKREAEAKVAAEEKAEADKMQVEEPASAAAAATTGPAKVSLLGIGGKKKTTKNGESKTGGKKRSPGEIRIQKGTFFYSNRLTSGLS
jgi:membrane protein involved in colicin uptake